jgi:hypothetical protein
MKTQRAARVSTGMRLVVFGIVLSLIAFTLPSAGWAVDRFIIRGSSAFSDFETNDACFSTFVSISATEEVAIVPSGPSSSGGIIQVSITKTDTCNFYTPVLQAAGYSTLPGSDFEVGKNLAWATLNTTINVYDFISDSYFDVSVDLTWTATGDSSRSTIITRDKSPVLIFRQSIDGTSRIAEVVGSVSDGTTNFTPNPAPNAYISNVKTGSLSISKLH